MATTRLAITCLMSFALAGQTGRALPPRIASLVPPGTTVSSQSFTGVATMAVAEFSAERSIGVGRSVSYRLLIRAFDNTSPMWKMRESAHRVQMEERIGRKRKGLAPETANQGMFTADPVKETKHTWGSGLTQRVNNHPPRAKEYVDFYCAYYGMIGGIVFELSASGLPDSPDEADQWAQKVVQAIPGLSVSNIGDK